MKFKYLIMCLLFVSLFSCKKGDSYDVSKVTVFPTFELEPLAITAMGTTFTPAAVAKDGDKVIPVTIIGTFSTDAVGVYIVGYSATNSDGFSKTAQQTVIVYDPAALDNDLSGAYASNVVRTEANGSNPRIRNCAANITRIARGIFFVDCLLGGYYSIGSGYGPDYGVGGYISLESDGSITNLWNYSPGFGDGLEAFDNGSYNNGTGELYWESTYAAADIFHVTLNL